MIVLPDRDELDAVYEAEKDDQVMNSKEGKARWKGELASNSEASVCCTSSLALVVFLSRKANRQQIGQSRSR